LFQLSLRYEFFPNINPIAISFIRNSTINIKVMIFPRINEIPLVSSFPFGIVRHV
jgi:hypothetical protein